MSEYQFTVILQPEEDGGYSVLVPSLPGCHTEGDTLEEALKNAKEVIQLCIDVLLDENKPIPIETQPIVQTLKVVA